MMDAGRDTPTLAAICRHPGAILRKFDSTIFVTKIKNKMACASFIVKFQAKSATGPKYPPSLEYSEKYNEILVKCEERREVGLSKVPLGNKGDREQRAGGGRWGLNKTMMELKT
jgi:hypothetical protein